MPPMDHRPRLGLLQSSGLSAITTSVVISRGDRDGVLKRETNDLGRIDDPRSRRSS